jgi:hypothetical protein
MPPTNHHEPARNDREAEPLNLLPGEPSVRVTYALTATPLDPPPGSGLFTGLTPRLAAVVLTTYTSPGDVVIDATTDLSVEGVARAGAREYHHLTLPPVPSPESTASDLPMASLVLLHWPADSSSGDSDQIGGRTTSEGALARILRAGRQMARPDGHLVIVLERPSTPDLQELGRQVIGAARAVGAGQLRHIVVVTASGRHGHKADPGDAVPTERTPPIGGAQARQLLFVVSASDGGGHD